MSTVLIVEICRIQIDADFIAGLTGDGDQRKLEVRQEELDESVEK
jgi:hypothetical protein